MKILTLITLLLSGCAFHKDENKIASLNCYCVETSINCDICNK